MAERVRPYLFYDVALTICSTCFRKLEGKIVFQDDKVFLLKRCPEHGPERVLVADDVEYYRRCREVFIKKPEMPAHYNTPVKVGEFLYGVDGRQESGAALRCVEWASGTVRWTKPGFGCASLIAADGLLIAVVETGDVVLFDASADGYREKGRFAGLTKPVRARLLPA